MDTLTNLQADEKAAHGRRERWRLFRWVRENSDRAGAAQCFTPREGEVTIGVTVDGAAHVSGVKRCGSVWGCPLCAPVIREARAAVIDSLLGRALADGCELRFLTVTIQHAEHQQLAPLWEGLQAAYSYSFGGRAAQPGRETVAVTHREDVDHYDDETGAHRGRWPVDVVDEVIETRESWFYGQVRALDLTHGQNGWHPHIHAVLVFAPGTDHDLIDAWLDERREKYRRGLRSFGMYSAADQRGWDVRDVRSYDNAAEVGRYVTKVAGGWGAGLELARMDLKSARRGGRTPFELLRAAADGCKGSAHLWRIYENGSHGRRLIVASRKLLARYGIDPSELDDELGADQAEVAPVDEFVFVHRVAGDEWTRLLRAGYVPDLLNHLIEAGREIAHNLRTVQSGAPPGG